ncbi:putative two-component system sensor protein histidine kinase [Pedobacter sp. BAL39]|uniref:histidine kinase n=1 Tax=Pedobacter sp. BAL39 TaxID=391596 RepID=UPI0001559CA8|nr:sensor histidine kinase [Pedobacter sp. BAL39]EDM38374.1 putative two-component system sensor protein histidine kinase [Pedobacter sp. BAL39]
MNNFVQLEINEKNRWVYFSKYRWLAHVGYWLWVLFAGTFSHTDEPITVDFIYRDFFLDNIMIAIFYYVHCLILIPYFFRRNRYLLFWTLVVIGYFGITAIDVVWYKTVIWPHEPAIQAKSFMDHYQTRLSGYLMNFFIFSIMLYFMEKNEENDTLKEVEDEKKKIEQVKLDMLKTNISPDFLLRSLRQLKQAAAVPEEYTSEAILTFADLLRYRLYRGRNASSALKEELAAFQSFIHFIDLEKHQHHLSVELTMQGEAEDKIISPLSLVNLLEPFCKANPQSPATLSIMLLIEEQELILQMYYNAGAAPQLVADLEAYGYDYRQLYGTNVIFHFENCENESCTINLTLPIATAEAKVVNPTS